MINFFFVENTHKIEEYYQSVDLFVLSSKREGLPNALLEAMACGLPVIVSKLKGIVDWLVEDGINGILAEPGIRDNLGKAILQVLKDYNQAESLGFEARETTIDRFSINKVAEDYFQLYGKLVT
tara:strand:+ start:14 stop:385 length:372 start_codon:yes stop_codon:yes gene_type:complete